MKKILFSLLLLSPSFVSADYTYDWQTGNSYSTYDTYNGTNVYGSNLNTGSTWSAHINDNGDMTGFDSNFNSWSYDASSGNYINYGTGVMCMGEGELRQCF